MRKETDLGSLLLALLIIRILHRQFDFNYVNENYIHILDIRWAG
jgi:hypothetical protein